MPDVIEAGQIGVTGGIRITSAVRMPDQSGPDFGRPVNVTICSVIPRELNMFQWHAAYTEDDAKKPAGAWRGKGRTHYRLPKPEPGGYSTITIYDGIVRVIQPQAMTQDGSAQMAMGTISAYEIASKLLNAWGANLFGATPERMPGIGIIAGKILTKDGQQRVVPTDEELQALKDKHMLWSQKLVSDADLLADQKQVSAIGENMREARVYTGEVRDWARGYVPMKECIGCGDTIRATSQTCKGCGNLLKVAFDLGYTVETVPDKTLAEGMRRLASQSATKRN